MNNTSEPVTLSSEQLVLLINRAQIAGYNKAVNALNNLFKNGCLCDIRDLESCLNFDSIGPLDYLEQNIKEILK